jgi:hypothetical protein
LLEPEFLALKNVVVARLGKLAEEEQHREENSTPVLGR